jgi:hypothetical protein
MTCNVWATDAMIDTQLVRHFSAPDSYYTENLDSINRAKSQYCTGVVLPRSSFPPSKLVLTRIVGPTNPMPHFINNTFSFISRELKEVLCRFDLGQTAFHPVTLYGLNEKKVLGPEYFYLNVAAAKGAFLPEESVVRKNAYASKGYNVRFSSEKAKVAVNSTACGGVDLWMETDLDGILFLSERLMQALEDSGLVSQLRFHKCKVIQEG